MDRATDLELPEAAAYRFRGIALDPSRGVLLRPDGAEVELRPKAAAVLRQLVRSPGRVVSRDDLMEAVWPGVVVTDDSITQCVAEIRRALGDEGAQLLRTFSRRGYMLVAEVAAGDAWPVAAAAPKGGAPPFRDGTAAALARGVSGLEDAPSRHRLRHRAALLAAPALLTGALAGGIGWQGLSGDRVPPVASSPVATPPEPSDPGAETAPATPRPYLSMVVLPFAPLGGDAEQDQLADGITEEVTSAVALISGSFVIGRGAAFAYKGQAADARRIGRELGVRYVVQGSARREGPQVRINVQLLDAGTGAHLWADSFDEPLVGFAALTRAIASRIAATLSARLLEVGSDRMLPSERPQDADAVALTIRGRALLNRTSLEGTLEALRVTEQALLLDDRSPPDAHALMGHLLTTLWSVDGPGDRDDLLRRAEAHAARALALQPRHVRGHYVRGMVHQARQRFDEALAEFDITVGLAPNFGPVHARRAWVMSSIDRPEQALAGFARAMRISPRDPWVGGWHNGSAFASQMLGRDEDALAHAVRAVAASQGLAETHLNLAAAYALLGRSEEARHALAEYRRLRPDATAEGLRRRWREWSEHPLFVATRDRQIEALRAIGLPER